MGSFSNARVSLSILASSWSAYHPTGQVFQMGHQFGNVKTVWVMEDMVDANMNARYEC